MLIFLLSSLGTRVEDKNKNKLAASDAFSCQISTANYNYAMNGTALDKFINFTC